MIAKCKITGEQPGMATLGTSRKTPGSVRAFELSTWILTKSEQLSRKCSVQAAVGEQGSSSQDWPSLRTSIQSLATSPAGDARD